MKQPILKSHERLTHEDEYERRVKLADLTDKALIAFLESGRPIERYPGSQWFLHVLFQTMNQTSGTVLRRHHALDFCIAVLQNLIDYYEATPVAMQQAGKNGKEAKK